MAEALRTKLLQGSLHRKGHQHGIPISSPRQYSESRGQDHLPPKLAVGLWQENASSPELRRRFLFRLAVALHAYGGSAPRTEYLIERAGDRLGVETNIAVYPTLILLSFADAIDDSRAIGPAIHLITVESELDVGKLGRADELANRVGMGEVPLVLSYWRLKAIATSPPAFGTWSRLCSFALSACMASLLFFEGNIWCACFSFLLGLLVGALNILATRSHLFGSVLEFVAAILVSFFSRLISTYLQSLNVCFSSLAVSALVELLPGMPLTLGVSEMVAKSHVTGTSRIMHALFLALQLGFGLAVGDSFVWWDKHAKQQDEKCLPPALPVWSNAIWLAGYSVATNILLNARLNQWPGMTLSAAVGYIVSEAATQLGASASTVLAAFAVGVTGTSYSYMTGDLPLAMVLSGVLLLVPGGLGVEGVAGMFRNEVTSGMSFVFNMLVVSLAITIGLLLAKFLQPAGLFGASKEGQHNKRTLAAHLEADEEHMAI